MTTDILRPPVPGDPTADAYQDWLHLNVLDRSSGIVGIVNIALHGALDDPRSRAIGTALFHVPGAGWVGNAEVSALEDVRCGLASLGLRHVAIAVDPRRDAVLVSAQWPDDGIDLRAVAHAVSAPVEIDVPMPFGPGWIAWLVVPRLQLSGRLVHDGVVYDMRHALAYHDHNWGRWHWGDDIGWTWGAFVAPAPGAAIIYSRATDRAHRHDGGSALIVDVHAARRTFAGPAIECVYDGTLTTRLRRLPGALAALHQDRAAPALPAAVRVHADDGIDRVDVQFRAGAAAQLIAGDARRGGYGFVHEIVGDFEASGVIGGRAFACGGLAVIEHVD